MQLFSQHGMIGADDIGREAEKAAHHEPQTGTGDACCSFVVKTRQ
jgi:hypothetical protein